MTIMAAAAKSHSPVLLAVVVVVAVLLVAFVLWVTIRAIKGDLAAGRAALEWNRDRRSDGAEGGHGRR
jgi:uncharacterized membrane protein YqiK